MTRKFQARSQVGTQEFDTAEQAATFVESTGTSGAVIEFNVEPNLPGCLPALVYRSLAMWTMENGVWSAVAIFGGSGESMGEERPGSNAIFNRMVASKPFVLQLKTVYGDWVMAGSDYDSRFKTENQANAKMAKSVVSSKKWGMATEYRVIDSRKAD